MNHIVQWIKKSNYTVVLSGAGMSTESGIPDFRSKDGWWKKVDPLTIATVDALENNYDLFHEFYSARINALTHCSPHQGHFILSKWEQEGYLHHIATQNVDGLHQQAGTEHISELHGSITKIKCHSCQANDEQERFLQKLPCKQCNGKLRPDVVLFGEMLPEDAWQQSLNAMKNADVVIVIGTSLQVYPVNQLPSMTKGKLIYMNKEIAEESVMFDATLKGSAGELLHDLENKLLAAK